MTSLKKESYSMMSLNFIDVPVWDIENPNLGHSLQENKCSQKKIFFFISCSHVPDWNKRKKNQWFGGGVNNTRIFFSWSI